MTNRSAPPARGLSRMEAAHYIGVSASLFDELVKDGRMPPAKRINARLVWDRRALDDAFEELPSNIYEANLSEVTNPFD